MFKKFSLIFISLSLAIITVFCSACGKNYTKNTSSLTNSEKVDFDQIKIENYSDKDVAKLLDFEKGLDMYGQKSINIIGDSISQGKNAEKLYDDSWAAIFKKALGDKIGSYNMGFVSFNDNDPYGVVTVKEIHKITPDANWAKANGYLSPNTPGNFSYTAGAFTNGANLTIELNRKEGGIDRHINGFYIYYVSGPTYGKFDIKLNGSLLKTVDCYSDVVNYCARTEYIALPEGTADELKIELVKSGNGAEIVTIAGISYIDDPEAVTVNNYSLSGIKLTEIDDGLLKELSKANIVIFTLGTNDAGTKVPIEGFKKQLKAVIDACEANGSTLIVGDFIWARDGNEHWADKYKTALNAMANAAKGYFLDFTVLPLDKVLYLKPDKKDSCHPTLEGHKLVAQNLCKFFELEIK